MSRALVTTPIGNVGREVVRACTARGLVVRAAHRDLAAAARHLPGVDVARFDFLERSTWAAALAGCDGVFLLRPPPLGNMETTLCPFADAAYVAGVKHIVFLSVAGANRMKWVPRHFSGPKAPCP